MDRLERAVEAVEREFIDAGKMFTAMDVGNVLKSRGVNARQRDISPIVREHFNAGLYDMSGYTRRLIDVRDGKAQAFLYMPHGCNPAHYASTHQEPVPWKPDEPVFPDREVNVAVVEDEGGLVIRISYD